MADPLPARVRWPEPQDQECEGSEPRVILVKGNPPRRVGEHHLIQKRQKAATKARVEKLLRTDKIDNGDSEGHGYVPKPHLGNCGFHFCSFGEDAGDPQKRADEWNQLKRSPANVLMLTEATDELFNYLGRDPSADSVGDGAPDPSAVADTQVVEWQNGSAGNGWP